MDQDHLNKTMESKEVLHITFVQKKKEGRLITKFIVKEGNIITRTTNSLIMRIMQYNTIHIVLIIY